MFSAFFKKNSGNEPSVIQVIYFSASKILPLTFLFLILSLNPPHCSICPLLLVLTSLSLKNAFPLSLPQTLTNL